VEAKAAGTRIEAIAARRGTTLREVAEKAGVSIACVYGIVSGRTTDPR
jgi:AcrR family transcriptional regulator